MKELIDQERDETEKKENANEALKKQNKDLQKLLDAAETKSRELEV